MSRARGAATPVDAAVGPRIGCAPCFAPPATTTSTTITATSVGTGRARAGERLAPTTPGAALAWPVLTGRAFFVFPTVGRASDSPLTIRVPHATPTASAIHHAPHRPAQQRPPDRKSVV